ncbi:MAG: YicC/YloC family endoribonuclease, partial [Stellaceae bacterium]
MTPGGTGEKPSVGVASMTGFARAQGQAHGVSWAWELKSVNGRSLDLRLRLGPGFDALEPELRGVVAQRFRRGNLSGILLVTRTAPAALRINREALAQLVALINDLTGEIEAAPPRLDGLLALRGVIETVEDEAEAVVEARQRAVLAGWTAAIDHLAAARAEEGACIAVLLEAQLDEMAALLAAAESCAAAQPAAILERLRMALAGLADLASTMPEERVAQEVAMLAARSDTREEIERLR